MTISQIKVGNDTHDITLPGLTASVAELNYVDGVTSNIQTQLNKKTENAYSHIRFVNATSTFAGAPSMGENPEIIAQSKNSTIAMIAGNSLISFDNVSDYNTDDSVTITVHADYEGAADDALAEAKTYTTNQINSYKTTVNSTYETKTDANTKLNDAKTYADNAAKAVKDSLLGGAGAAYDTLKELADLIQANDSILDALQPLVENKVKMHFWESGD